MYLNFYLDFGPLSLGQLVRFCDKLNAKLASVPVGSEIYFYSSSHSQRRANAIMLITAWTMIYLSRTPEEAYRPFRGIRPAPPPFHDASPYPCTFRLTISDCLRGIDKALRYGFVDLEAFDVEEYEHYERVEHGDLNWIHRAKFLSFAGPQDLSTAPEDGYPTLAPSHYIPYFRRNNVQLVVRLNKKHYLRERFLRAGIRHEDMYYLDGSCPPAPVLQRFLAAAEACPGAIAVHCKAGLGRTGTLIGCYLMKHYRFTAAEAIGWIRTCRPGSVIGPQQHYLADVQDELWRLGDAYRRRHGPMPGFVDAPGAAACAAVPRLPCRAEPAPRPRPELGAAATDGATGRAAGSHALRPRLSARNGGARSSTGGETQGDKLRARRAARAVAEGGGSKRHAALRGVCA